jgi:hypothetical protein
MGDARVTRSSHLEELPITGHCNVTSSRMTLIGTICYVSLLMLNAIAILNEERFLARSE